MKTAALLVSICAAVLAYTVTQARTYRAAVYEHKVIFPWPWATNRPMALSQMMVNMKAFQEKAHIAGKQGVDIMVFGEDSLYGYYMRYRHVIKHYLEPIPDPKLIMWNPCNEPMRFPQAEIQVELSCMAKRNRMYIVANMGDIQLCELGDPHCPSEGWYQYNTNVAYDKEGNFIARYHKQNRYIEPQFNAPVHPEYVYFDTKFGRFGLVVCNDIMFYDPMVELVREYNVTDIVLPTAWPESLPLYSSIGFISSFAVGHNVNLLHANIREPHNPDTYVYGSGLYTPAGPVKYVYDAVSTMGILIIGDVPVNERLPKKLPCDVNPLLFGQPNMKSLALPEFKADMFKDWFNFVHVKGTEGTVTVCQERFCCYLNYKKSASLEMYAFGVFNGLHKAYGPIYQQICVLMKCQTNNPLSCGKHVLSANTHFSHFHIKGSFSSPFIQPQIIQSGPGYQLELPPIGSFNYDAAGLTGLAVKKPLIHAALIGRVYRKDCITCYGG
ncbi:pantetheinase-like [Mercenaria mercenaria]|uniref:pantetheinase-like n=1 Tax=Mercenaria mercenaria TaxID=6596 RepID=UPI00234F19CB|nr:pantetheinase-like [Mercenaria mercenaria]